MRLNPAAFDRHLNHIGQQVLWRRSYACACVSPTSGAPDPKHQLCGGKGRLWVDPVQCTTGVASQKTLAQWIASGRYETGDAVLSIPQSSALYDAGQYDRITMLNSTDVFSQALHHGAPSERLIFNVEKVTRVFWLDPTTRLPVDGGIPTVGPTGLLTWSAGEPPPGVTYSITGTKFSDYFIYDNYSSDRGEHSGARLPKRVIARNFSLFGR